MTINNIFSDLQRIILCNGEGNKDKITFAEVTLITKFINNYWMSIIISEKVKVYWTPHKGVKFQKGTLEDLQNMLVFLQLIK